MSTTFERRVAEAWVRLAHAHRQFLADVLAAARKASVDAVERAFSDALAARRPLADSVRARDRLAQSSEQVQGAMNFPERPVTVITAGARVVVDRVLAQVREAPGSHIGELSASLAMPAATVRRHLRQRAAENAIRIEGAGGPWLGRARQTFFSRDPEPLTADRAACRTEAHA